jgi:ribosomal protein S18 acetylase RimI-like enzyme
MKDALGHGSNPRGTHSSGVDKIGGAYRVANDVSDAHQGSIYGSIYAEHNQSGQHVGSIDYSASNKIIGKGKDAVIGKEVSIQMIKVLEEHQHQGVASKMLDKLQEEFTRGGHKPTLHWGGTTPEGSALRKAYYRAKAGK